MSNNRQDRETTRIESFSDAIFGFSATLLVVSLEVPTRFDDLIRELQGFGAFGLSFMALVMIWLVHRAFFQRFPVADRMIIVLNSVLLFVVLFYVYPLKYVTIGLAQLIFGTYAAGGVVIEGPQQLGDLFVLYGLGFVAIFVCVALMYHHAGRLSARSGEDPEGAKRARFWSRHYALFGVVGMVSIVLAWAQTGISFGLPGIVYGAIGLTSVLHARAFQKKYGPVDG